MVRKSFATRGMDINGEARTKDVSILQYLKGAACKTGRNVHRGKYAINARWLLDRIKRSRHSRGPIANGVRRRVMKLLASCSHVE